jgi:hypothetical protein
MELLGLLCITAGEVIDRLSHAAVAFGSKRTEPQTLKLGIVASAAIRYMSRSLT